ncbi:MAG: hypothetical protein CVU73_00480 [Deltaproteobacteria bacterium HGW-Deltaproteobacteria-8]|jgi:hypothetical protein|nr:MAG: hypothetical protein CVU73_00480 [Deltaproteobacteria bacterium HGW-Deltaproteobacteria-8]
MAEDFRSLLKESMRNDARGERWFEDLDIAGIFYLSIQASALHDSTPSELLNDVNEYKAFQVILQTKPGVSICGKRSAWDHLALFDWLPLFVEESPILREAANVPVSVVQRIFEDVSACASAHPEMLMKKRLASIKVL